MRDIKNLVIAACVLCSVLGCSPAFAQVEPTPAPVAAAPADQTDQTIPGAVPDLTGVIIIDPNSHKVTVDVGLFGSKLIEWFIATFGGVITLALSAWLITLVQKMRIQATDALRKRFQEIILSGLSIGAAKAEEALQDAPKIDIKNAAAVTAIQYVQDHGAETAKKLGLDVKTEQAVDVIKANIEKMVNDPAVATPASISPEKPIPVVIAPAAPPAAPGGGTS